MRFLSAVPADVVARRQWKGRSSCRCGGRPSGTAEEAAATNEGRQRVLMTTRT